MQPYFSIIIPVYNRAHSIRKAIESILTQTFQNFEIIVIDDASKDKTEEVVMSINDDRIHYIKNETNQERCISRNSGIEKSRGKYICFLDSDDYHLPYHLQEIYHEIQVKGEPEGFFFTNAWNETSEGVRSERMCPDFESVNSFTYFLRYTVNPQRWAVHRDVILTHLFDPKIVICEDMDTSLRILRAGTPIYQIKKRTTVYVAAEDSFTVSDPKKAEKELFYLRLIFERVELKKHLPRNESNRLLSMCYFHLASKTFQQTDKLKTIQYGLHSLILCPSGYNGNTLKPLLTMIFYSIPIIGNSMKAFIRFVR
jgi:glycosyltransferase involved in cell wall biosynthesis